MWDKIDRILNNLDWYAYLVIGFILCIAMGILAEWMIMTLFMFTIISTYFVHIGVLIILQFFINIKLTENEKDESHKDYINPLETIPERWNLLREKYGLDSA